MKKTPAYTCDPADPAHGQRLQLIDYGFQYHGDHNFPQDDITWFLMEKVK